MLRRFPGNPSEGIAPYMADVPDEKPRGRVTGGATSIHVNVPATTKRQLLSVLALRGENLTSWLLEQIDRYLANEGAETKRQVLQAMADEAAEDARKYQAQADAAAQAERERQAWRE